MPLQRFKAVGGVWVPNTQAVYGRIHFASTRAPLPAPVTAGMLIGFQQFPTSADYLKGGGSETPAQQYARSMVTYGRNDLQKLFYGGDLPATWQASREGVNTGTKTVMVCHNQGGVSPTGVSNILAGQHDTAVRNYIRSVPAGWRVLLVWNQEADADLQVSQGGVGTGGPLTKAQYRDGFNHIAGLCLADMAKQNTAQQVLRDGVVIEPHANFMNAAFRQGVWSDDRVPNKAVSISWDTYLNPPPSISSSPADYEQDTAGGNAASAAALHAAAAARIVDQNGVPYSTGGDGGGSRWGWAEVGAPWRVNDASAATRATTFDNLLRELGQAGGWFAIIWNSDTGQWDHRIMDYTTTPKPTATSGHQGVWPGPGKEPAIAVIRKHMGT